MSNQDILDMLEDDPIPLGRSQRAKDIREYGTLYCHFCEDEKCAKGGASTYVEVETGRSGSSNTYHGSVGVGSWKSSVTKRKGSRTSARVGVSHNTGRTYYKRVQVDICAACRQIRELPSDTWRMWIAFLIFLSIIPTYIYCVAKSYTYSRECMGLFNACHGTHPILGGFDGYDIGNVIVIFDIVLIAYLWISDSVVIKKRNAAIRKKYA